MATSMASTQTNGSTPTQDLCRQLRSPQDVFTILLLIGDDVVRTAVARLSGTTITLPWSNRHINLTPVAFSFGWMSFAFMGLAAAVGDCQLMPPPECAIKVLNCATNNVIDNQSWLLSRVIRDQECQLGMRYVQGQQRYPSQDAFPSANKPSTRSRTKRPLLRHLFQSGRATSIVQNASLIISIHRAGKPNPPIRDRSWWLAVGCIVVQLVAAAIGSYTHNWAVALVVYCGTAFALLTAGLSQWKEEKWSSRRLRTNTSKTVAFTRGNGSQHVIIIEAEADSDIRDDNPWDFEAMASSIKPRHVSTDIHLTVYSFLWMLLLLTSLGIKQGTWWLIGIGMVGMVQNVLVAALPMKIENTGLGLGAAIGTIVGSKQGEKIWTSAKEWSQDEVKAFCERPADPAGCVGVMGALIDLEKTVPGAGLALLHVFFPEVLLINEKRIWAYFEQKQIKARAGSDSEGAHEGAADGETRAHSQG